MSKLIVVDEVRETRIPFLRGMMVRSLQEAGLEFADAYNVATDIRDEYEDTEEITTRELKEKIQEVLSEDFPGAVADTFRQEKIFRRSLAVVHDDDSSEPFSRGVHYQRLASSSISPAKCLAITRKIHSQLVKNKVRRISAFDLTVMTCKMIREEVDQRHADYYLAWHDFLGQDLPLVILIGGVPGCGKSTVATEAANRLGIVRTQSTDMLREVMRMMIPQQLSPSLHTSSFRAGRKMQLPSQKEDSGEQVLYGFQVQSEMVEVACGAVIQRALNENVSIIVEGVHIRPSLLGKIKPGKAVVIPVCLAAFSRKRLAGYIKGRSDGNSQRRAKRYLDDIDKIWQLQTFLLSEADNADVEIIDNQKLDDTVSELLSVIIQTIHSRYKNRITELRKKYK